MTQLEIARALLVRQMGEPSRCSRCGEEVWWEHGAWHSLGQKCGDGPKSHLVRIPDLADSAAVERWLVR